jgi:hypothetical protein
MPHPDPSSGATLTHQPWRAGSPLSCTAGEGGERSETGEGSAALQVPVRRPREPSLLCRRQVASSAQLSASMNWAQRR